MSDMYGFAFSVLERQKHREREAVGLAATIFYHVLKVIIKN